MSFTRSANRHMRSDGHGRLQNLREGPRTVIVRADARYATSQAGQHLLQMTVNLLARQYEVVNEVIVDVPTVDVLDNVFFPPRIRADLAAELIALGRAVAGPEIEITDIALRSNREATCTVFVGPFNPSLESYFCVSAVAEGWRLDCATNRPTSFTPGSDSNPAGPYMAACFAVGAIFKFLWQLDPGIDLTATLWGCTEGAWNQLSIGKSPAGVNLPTTYLIGAGAVGAALGFTLAGVPQLHAEIVAIDPQKSDDTNRNRLVTMSYDETDKDKVLLLVELLKGTGIAVHPYVGRWPEYTADPDRKTPKHIRDRENAYRYEWVISCVDRNHHRRSIAIYVPKYVLGGSTQDFAAQVGLYSMRGQCECLACNHPVPKVKPTEELRDELVNMNQQELDQWFEKHDADNRERSAIEEYLRDPSCGTAGQAVLAKFGREGEADWSVGFVSVAAGVLLASVYMQTVLEGFESAVTKGSEYFAWFVRSSLGMSHALRKNVCDICSSVEKQHIYDHVWSEV